MNETQLRILIWDVCNNTPKLRTLLTEKDIHDIQDVAVKFAITDELIQFGPERD